MRHNILVNAICPGWVDTEMSQTDLQGIADGFGISKDEFYKMEMQSVPLGRMSAPEEIADLIAYLLSQKINYRTNHRYKLRRGDKHPILLLPPINY